MITDSIRLLGLIVLTKPFTYENGIVMCDYNSHVNVNDIKQLRIELEQEYNTYTDEQKTDEIIRKYSDDFYFLDRLISELENKL